MSNRHAAVLDGLGGRHRLASLLGLSYETVRKWYRRGIPSRHWHRIAALSPDVTAEYLDRTKPYGVQGGVRKPKKGRRR